MTLALSGCFLLDGRERRARDDTADPASLVVEVESARAWLEVWQGFPDAESSNLTVTLSVANELAGEVAIEGAFDVTVRNPSAGLSQSVLVWEQMEATIPAGTAMRTSFRGAIRSNELGVCSVLDSGGPVGAPPEGTLRASFTVRTSDGDLVLDDVPVTVSACVITD